MMACARAWEGMGLCGSCVQNCGVLRVCACVGQVGGDQRFEPTTLGLALAEAYDAIGYQLTKVLLTDRLCVIMPGRSEGFGEPKMYLNVVS
jgi:hypothetical protein